MSLPLPGASLAAPRCVPVTSPGDGLRDRYRCGAVGGVRCGSIERLPSDRGRRRHRGRRGGRYGRLGDVSGGRPRPEAGGSLEFSIAGICGALPLSSSVIAILKVPSTITTTLAPTSSERILEVIVDGSLAWPPGGLLERPAAGLVASRRRCGGLGGTARGGNEARRADRRACGRRNSTDGAFGSRDALGRRSGSPGRPGARFERMIGRQVRLDRDARCCAACGARISLMAFGAAVAERTVPAAKPHGIPAERRRNVAVPRPDSAIPVWAAAPSRPAVLRSAAGRMTGLVAFPAAARPAECVPRADRLRSSPAGRPHGRACCERPRANPGYGGRLPTG